MEENADIRAMLHRFADVLADALGSRQPVAAGSAENMKIRDFAEHAGLGESTVRKYLGEGMPANRMGRRRITIPVAAAEAWLVARGKGRAA